MLGQQLSSFSFYGAFQKTLIARHRNRGSRSLECTAQEGRKEKKEKKSVALLSGYPNLWASSKRTDSHPPHAHPRSAKPQGENIQGWTLLALARKAARALAHYSIVSPGRIYIIVQDMFWGQIFDGGMMEKNATHESLEKQTSLWTRA